MNDFKIDLNITKSVEDERSYCAVQLENGLKVIVVSDPETERGAACMRVGVGSFQDPLYVQGLAHFLEHMLFLGTEQYPQEGFFERYLAKYGGTTNANTSEEETNYFYDIEHGMFLDSLSKFSSFFKTPLLSKASSEREINAIQSELELNLQSDEWRIYQLSSHLCDSESVLNKFSIGSKDSLLKKTKLEGVDLHDELVKFYNEHYSANNMYLAVLGIETLETLVKTVTACFGKVENKNTKPCAFPLIPFNKDFLKIDVRTEPIKETSKLIIQWMLPSIQPHYKENPVFILSHLLGHEGRGSLFSLLKNKQWAKSLTSGPYMNLKDICVFYLKIKLTKIGEENRDNIVSLIFKYLFMLKRSSDDQLKDVFEEVSLIQRNNFMFKKKEKPLNYVQTLASNLSLYETVDVLTGDSFLYRFDIDLLRFYIDLVINVENLRMFTISKTALDGKETQSEPIFGTRYFYDKIPDEYFQKLFSGQEPGSIDECGGVFHLPIRNKFIASDFKLRVDPESSSLDPNSHPEKIIETPLYECFYKPDLIFRKPLVYLMLRFITPVSYTRSLREAVLSLVTAKYLDLMIKEEAYAASIAGLSLLFRFSKIGVEVELNGYNDKISDLLDLLLDTIKDQSLDEGVFNVSKEHMLNQFNSFDSSPIYSRAIYNTNYCLENIHWHNRLMCETVKDISSEDLRKFRRTIFDKCYVKSYFSGNLSRNEAMDLGHKKIEKFLNETGSKPLAKGEIPVVRGVKLQRKTYYFEELSPNPEDPNSCAYVMFQIGKNSDYAVMNALLFKLITCEAFYNQLRTNENLGYYVFCDKVELAKTVYIAVMVHGEYHPLYSCERIHSMLKTLETTIREMSEHKFQKYVTTLLHRVKEKKQNLGMQVKYYWKEIQNGSYKFDRKLERERIVKELNKKDFTEFINRKIFSTETSRKLIIGVVNQKAKESRKMPSDFERIDKVEEFKKKMELMPAA